MDEDETPLPPTPPDHTAGGRFVRGNGPYIPSEEWHSTFKSPDGGTSIVGQDLAAVVRFTKPDDTIHILAKNALLTGDLADYGMAMDALQESDYGRHRADRDNLFAHVGLRGRLVAAGLPVGRVYDAVEGLLRRKLVDHAITHGFTVGRNGVVYVRGLSRRKPAAEQYARDYESALPETSPVGGRGQAERGGGLVASAVPVDTAGEETL